MRVTTTNLFGERSVFVEKLYFDISAHWERLWKIKTDFISVFSGSLENITGDFHDQSLTAIYFDW